MIYNLNLSFTWDDAKAELNLKKHGVRFSDCVTVWLDDQSLEIEDPDHSAHEQRWIRMGYSLNAQLLVIVFCEPHQDEIRLISARKAQRREREHYHEKNK
jgi:uncharacterized DUF497 family protein